MKKAIIFDFDYTLGDSTKGIVQCANYALKQVGNPAKNTEDIKKTVGLSLKETYFALTKNRDLDKAEQFAKLFKQKADVVMVDNTELYAGVKDALKVLKSKGYKLGIVTTKFHYRIKQLLSKFDADDLIDIIVGAEDVNNEKPDPEGLVWAIKQFKVTNEEVLYVGDSLVDAMTAQSAKVDFAAVLTGTSTEDDFKAYNCVYLGKDISDICKYVLAMEQRD